MIEKFLNQIIREPNKTTLQKAKLEIIDWIGYSLAGTFTKQALPFRNLQKELPKGKSLYLFDQKQLNIIWSFINVQDYKKTIYEKQCYGGCLGVI